MPTSRDLDDHSRRMISKRIDDALAYVHDLANVDTLHACRKLFRSRVPLHLRAYVAAALLLDQTSGGRASPVKGDKGKRQPERRERTGGGKQAVRGETRNADQRGRQADQHKAPREPAPTRERRYRGEGVTLFVSAGRRQRFYARVALDTLFALPGVAEEHIGEVRTMDNYSFVTVDPAAEERILSGLNGRDFRGRALSANRARKKGAHGEDEPQAAEQHGDGVAGTEENPTEVS